MLSANEEVGSWLLACISTLGRRQLALERYHREDMQYTWIGLAGERCVNERNCIDIHRDAERIQ